MAQGFPKGEIIIDPDRLALRFLQPDSEHAMHLHVCAGMQGYVVGGYQFEFIPIVLSHVCRQRTHYHQLVTTVL